MSPGRTDIAIVRRHLVALEQAIAHLSHHQGRPVESLTSNLDLLWAIERGLQLCVQNALDIASHLVASAGADAADYAGSIDQLAVIGVMPKEFAQRFRAIAGFRNILVHGYLSVDPAILHLVLNERLKDLTQFSEYVAQHLAKIPS